MRGLYCAGQENFQGYWGGQFKCNPVDCQMFLLDFDCFKDIVAVKKFIYPPILILFSVANYSAISSHHSSICYSHAAPCGSKV